MLKHIPFYASLLGREITGKIKATNRHVLVYGAIEVHSTGKLGCIASNQTIADETGLATRVVSLTISDLKKAGWVDFTLDQNFFRSPITPLLNISTPYTKNVPTPTLNNTPPLHKNTHIDNNIGNSKVTVKATASPVASLKATKVKKSVGLSKKPINLEDPKVNDVIKCFELVDVNYSVLYKRTTERKAVETLLTLHKYQSIADMLAKAVIYNKLPYVTSYDKIYTPTQLLRNWQKLKDKEAEIVIKPKIAQQEKNETAKTRVAGWN